MKTLSVVISAFNEEKKIKDCLESVKFADEIIVIDNESTDKTAEIAKKYGAKIITQKNNPLKIDLQKNIGFSKATGDFILSLDADERVTPALADEIQVILNYEFPKDGYQIPRKNIIFGKWIEHTGWYPDYQLRLFKKGKGKFEEDRVHVQLEIIGDIDRLENPMEHLNYETVSQFLSKLDVYTTSQAHDMIKNNNQVHIYDAISMPAEEFLKRYFAEKGYKDGMHGLVLSLLMGFYYLIIFTKVWEMQKFEDTYTNTLPVFEEEFKKTARDTAFWILKEKKDNTKSGLKKFLLSIQGKVKR